MDLCIYTGDETLASLDAFEVTLGGTESIRGSTGLVAATLRSHELSSRLQVLRHTKEEAEAHVTRYL